MTKGIYRFYWDCGRMGDVTGVFVADSEQIEDAIGKELYFGEILGKYSEVYGRLKEQDITLLTTEEVAIDIVSKYNLENGYNPLEYLPEEEDEDDSNDD